MTPLLKDLSEIAANAIDLFYKKVETINPIMGITDKALRNQGVNADAITIDCVALNKKVVILLHDDKPNMAGIALGNKEGDIHSSFEEPITNISETYLIKLMEENFFEASE